MTEADQEFMPEAVRQKVNSLLEIAPKTEADREARDFIPECVKQKGNPILYNAPQIEADREFMPESCVLS